MFPFNADLLANRLGISLQGLWFLTLSMDFKTDRRVYLKKRIKVGKHSRLVWTANNPLRKVHKALGALLEGYYKPNGLSYAYTKGVSIRDAAEKLSPSKYVYTLDIKKHFPSIKMNVIKKCLISLGIDPEVSFIISRLCCVHYADMDILAQGFCIAPLIANLVSELTLDPIVLSHLPQDGNYVRYSDNIFIGCSEPHPTLLINLAKDIYLGTGHITHKHKCMPYYRRQIVLGLVINVHLSPPKEKVTSIVGQLYIATKGSLQKEELTSLKATANYYLPFIRGNKKHKILKLLEKL